MRSLFGVMIFAALVCGCRSTNAADPVSNSDESSTRLPNVLIILADDLGYGDISCYGNTVFKTPNIDALAKNGVRFSRAYSSASTCTPARYSMLTGEFSWRRPGTGIAPGDAKMIIEKDRPNLARMFRNAHYATAAIGKWHLGLGEGRAPINWNAPITVGPNQLGFDYMFMMAATNDRVPCVYLEQQQVVNGDPNDPIEVSYGKPVGNDPTVVSHPDLVKMKPTPGKGHNNTIINGIGRIGYMKGGHKARWIDEDQADIFTGAAKKWLAQTVTEHPEQPFFMYYGSQDPHVPRTPHARFVGKSGLGPRGDAILQLDYVVGELTSELKRLGQLENTIIVFTSDNGPILEDGYIDQAAELNAENKHTPWGKNFRGTKYSTLEGGGRVPLIVSYPNGAAKGKVSDAMISQVDFLGSFSEMTHQCVDTELAQDTRPLFNVLMGKSDVGRDFCMYQGQGRLTVFDKDWKFSAQYSNQAPGMKKNRELYHFSADNKEQKNCIKAHPGEVERLMAYYQQEQAKPNSLEVYKARRQKDAPAQKK